MAGLLLLLSWLPLSSARQGKQDVGISDRWRSPGAGAHLLRLAALPLERKKTLVREDLVALYRRGLG